MYINSRTIYKNIRKQNIMNDIKINDKVVFNNQTRKGKFKNHEVGIVIGLTNEFVIIEPNNPDHFDHLDNHKIYRRYKNVIVIEDYKDPYLRLAAEIDNFKKNNIKRANELSESGKRQVLMYLLDIKDDFDRALDNIKDENDKEGVQYIINKLDNILSTYGIVKYTNNDEIIEFDPNKHEAISVLLTDDKKKDNKIAYIIKHGYMINNEIFRFCTCVVYKYNE